MYGLEITEKTTVKDLVRSGVLLIEVVNSPKYSPELKKAARERMRENVLSVQSGRWV